MESFKEIDQAIRRGQIRQASLRIQAFWKNGQNLTRPERLELSRLARRAYLPRVSILLLRPFVRPSSARVVESHPEEQLEFAAALIAAGARTEGVEILESLDPQKFPERDLFVSFALFSAWNYAAALPLLRRYSSHPALDPYARLVGQVNLAAALVHEREIREAAVVLSELDASARAGNHTLLLRNILKLDAERAIYARQFEHAEQCLAEAHAMSGKSPEDDLYLEKWRAIAHVAGGDSTGLGALRRIREDALVLEEWEGVRDCDYHLSVYGKDLALGMKLYFGTPYSTYRSRLLRDFPDLHEALPDQYGWELQAPRGPHQEVWLEGAAVCNESQSLLKTGQVLQRLFKALAADFYRPANLVELYSLVFPDQHYHPRTSTDSMHQALRRLRAFFADQDLPLRVSESRAHYCLQAESPVTLWVRSENAFPATPIGLERDLIQLEALLPRVGAKEFTAQEAAAIWEVSRNWALNRIRKLHRQNLLERHGQGPQTRYRLVRSTK